MARYKTRKIKIIEAEQWFPDRHVTGVRLVAEASNPGRDGEQAFFTPEHYVVDSLQGEVSIHPGDWVIAESDGCHHYPCNPEVFEATYEIMEE